MSTGGGRVLIVDDEALVRETLRNVLTDEGYTVDLATDGAEALERVREAAPDAILLDLMMPGMNGRQFLEALRENPRHERIPVLVMTAVTGLTVPAAGLGASEVVEKPFAIDDVLNKVALAVYRARQARGTEPPPPRAAPRRGVVLMALRNRAAVAEVDAQLSARGYAVVALTRVNAQLARLVRALRPSGLLVDLVDDDERTVIDQLRREPGESAMPIVVVAPPPVAIDDELRAFLALMP